MDLWAWALILTLAALACVTVIQRGKIDGLEDERRAMRRELYAHQQMSGIHYQKRTRSADRVLPNPDALTCRRKNCPFSALPHTIGAHLR